MAVSLPEFEVLNQDISAQLDIDALIQKYIVPVEKIRSLSKVPQGKKGTNLFSDFASVSFELEPQESLTHAFYRFLGLPVVAPDGSFYSPGFQPGEIRKLKRKQEIANKLAGSELENILLKRELLFQEKKGFFSFQDLRSSLLAIVLKIPKNFNILDPSIGPLTIDNQNYIVAERKKEVQSFISRNPQLETQISNAQKSFSSSCFSFDLTHGQHIIKPFSLHPRIENFILPDDRQICVPFLNEKKETILSSFSELLRPGIELIIQERIFPSNKTSWLPNLEKILSNNKSPSIEENIQIQDLKTSISSLFSSLDISNENILNIIDDQNSYNIFIFDQLIKTLRFLIVKLIKAFQILDQIETQINWYPVLSTSGPVDGKKNAFLLFGNAKNFPLDQKILELRIKKLDYEKGNNIASSRGNFASPFDVQSSDVNESLYASALDEALHTRSILGQQGFRALQEIEYLTGEISGLGLIDVIITYAALWTIPLSSLFGFLDSEAYDRIHNTFSFLSSVIDGAGRDDIFISLQNLEKNVFNLQIFVDRLIEEEKLSINMI